MSEIIWHNRILATIIVVLAVLFFSGLTARAEEPGVELAGFTKDQNFPRVRYFSKRFLSSDAGYRSGEKGNTSGLVLPHQFSLEQLLVEALDDEWSLEKRMRKHDHMKMTSLVASVSLSSSLSGSLSGSFSGSFSGGRSSASKPEARSDNSIGPNNGMTKSMTKRMLAVTRVARVDAEGDNLLGQLTKTLGMWNSLQLVADR